MVKNKKTKAFSLVDAIIILSVVAIAIAVATPILTRKIVNIDDIMAFGHGRYEIYYKEIVSYDNGNTYYEKTTNGGSNKGITVYERKTDSQYYKETNTVPKSTGDGLKDTLYEEFNNATTERNSNGDIIKVCFKTTEGVNKCVPVGGRYIIENADVVYKKYDIKNHKRLTGELDKNNYRIIEGRLTKKYKVSPKLWIISSKDTNNFEGTVISEPFERIISGSKTISENYLKPDSQGNVTGTFDPGDNIKNAVVHAQGGGGAGGGVNGNNLGGPKYLNQLSAVEISKIKNELYENFKKVTPSPYHKGVDNVIATCENCMNNENTWRNFANNPSQWMLLDTTTGQLIGKFDATNPMSMILPDNILKYSTQASSAINKLEDVEYNMPKILDRTNLGNIFKAGTSVRGNAGTGASSINVVVKKDVDLQCMRTHGTNSSKYDTARTELKGNAYGFKCNSKYDRVNYNYVTKSTTYKILSRCKTVSETNTNTSNKNNNSNTSGSASSPIKGNNKNNTFNALMAAKIDYSKYDKPESLLDKVKSYFNKDEIDLNYPVMHGATVCPAGDYPVTKRDEKTASCNYYNCNCNFDKSDNFTCNDDETSKKCVSGDTSEYEGYVNKERTENRKSLCATGVCTSICNAEYYNCKPDGTEYHTVNYKACKDANIYNCPKNEVTRKGDITNKKIQGGNGGAAGARAYVCASASEGVIAISVQKGADGTKNSGRQDAKLTINEADLLIVKQLENAEKYRWGDKGGDMQAILRVLNPLNPNKVTKTYTAFSGGGYPGQTYQSDYTYLDKQLGEGMSKFKELMNVYAGKMNGRASEYEIISGAKELYENSKNEMSPETQKEIESIIYGSEDPAIAINTALVSAGTNLQQLTAMINGAFANNKTTGNNAYEGQYVDNTKDSLIKMGYEYNDDGALVYKNSNGAVLSTIYFTPLPDTTIALSNKFVCKILFDNVKGKNGANGSSSSSCGETDRIGIGTDDGQLYNHIYAWAVPYAINSITYSQAGEAGEYKVAKVPRVTGAFKITIGKGGVWSSGDAWKKGTIQGPNGGDTIVEMAKNRNANANYKNIVTAKGGKGGSRIAQSENYNLCNANSNKVKCQASNGGNSIDCCLNENGTRSSKDIIETAIKYSAIENIKSLVGQSELIGLGLGRGAEAAGARAGNEIAGGPVQIYNISYDKKCTECAAKRMVYSSGSNATPNNSTSNTPIKPSALNFKGGDGAVIITW